VLVVVGVPPVDQMLTTGHVSVGDIRRTFPQDLRSVKEYAAGGAMWLASLVGPYRGMGREQGGTLVDDRLPA
jgi:hypothetical protein